MIKKLVLIIGLLIAPFNTYADDSVWDKDVHELFDIWKNNIKETWDNPEHYDLYIPVNTWHNRLFYDKDKIDDYNEEPWGLGGGTSRYDDDGDWHGLYFMAFKDSNKHLQTIFGYAYMKYWYYGCLNDWRAGLGFTTSLTQRVDYYMIPVPLPLPMFGFGYKDLDIQAAYVPGVKNNGNVLFTWVKYQF